MLLSLVLLGVLRGINVLVPLYNKYIGKFIPYSKGSLWRQAIVLFSLVLLGVLRGINVLVPLYNKYIGKFIPYSKGSLWRQTIVLISLVLLGVIRGINVLVPLYNKYIGTFTLAHLLPKVGVLPRKRWLRLNMTEKLFTGTLRINQPTFTLLLAFRQSIELLSPVLLGDLKGINVLVPLYNKHIGKFIPYSKGSLWRQAYVLLSLVCLGVLSGIETGYILLLSVVLQRALLPLCNTYIGKCIPYSTFVHFNKKTYFE